MRTTALALTLALAACGSFQAAVEQHQKRPALAHKDWTAEIPQKANPAISAPPRSTQQVYISELELPPDAGRGARRTESAREGIARKCIAEWPDDYRMQEYCMQKQAGAYNRLYGD